MLRDVFKKWTSKQVRIIRVNHALLLQSYLNLAPRSSSGHFTELIQLDFIGLNVAIKPVVWFSYDTNGCETD